MRPALAPSPSGSSHRQAPGHPWTASALCSSLLTQLPSLSGVRSAHSQLIYRPPSWDPPASLTGEVTRQPTLTEPQRMLGPSASRLLSRACRQPGGGAPTPPTARSLAGRLGPAGGSAPGGRQAEGGTSNGYHLLSTYLTAGKAGCFTDTSPEPQTPPRRRDH